MIIQNKEKLIDYFNHGNKVKYVLFWGHQKENNRISKSCLSQWYDSPFNEDGKKFFTAEHYMMYHKAKLFDDIAAAEKVLLTNNPGEAKAIGRKVSGFDDSIWLENRFEIVVNANIAKFSQNNPLRDFLLNTGNRVLVEASPVDKIWGIGLTHNNPDSENPNNWKGLNLLGFALMKVRDLLSK